MGIPPRVAIATVSHALGSQDSNQAKVRQPASFMALMGPGEVGLGYSGLDRVPQAEFLIFLRVLGNIGPVHIILLLLFGGYSWLRALDAWDLGGLFGITKDVCGVQWNPLAHTE